METELPTQKQMLQMVQRKIEPQTTIPNQTQQPLDTIHSTVQQINGKWKTTKRPHMNAEPKQPSHQHNMNDDTAKQVGGIETLDQDKYYHSLGLFHKGLTCSRQLCHFFRPPGQSNTVP